VIFEDCILKPTGRSRQKDPLILREYQTYAAKTCAQHGDSAMKIYEAQRSVYNEILYLAPIKKKHIGL